MEETIAKDNINEVAAKYIEGIAEKCKRIKPLVVISTLTYNHEPYLRDALEGFVMQQTDFPFVAVVHDDASTDGTAAVLREYAEKYPDIILPIFEKENQHSKRDGSLGRIMRTARDTTGAKYVAMCEGDDYWTDPHKLQKQVDFLESHPDYSMCFASVDILDSVTGENGKYKSESRDYTAIEVYADVCIPTCTMLFRKELLDSEVYKKFLRIKNPVFGDLYINMAAASMGKIFSIGDKVGVYRVLQTGASQHIARNPYAHFRNRIAVSKIMGKEFVKEDRKLFKRDIIPALKNSHRNFPKNLFYFFRLLWFAPKESTQRLWLWVRNGVICKIKK